MYYTAQSEIQIGKVKINGVTEVEIEESVAIIGDTATITLPRKMLCNEGKSLLDVIKKGDEVTIKLGYNGKLIKEFGGYLSQIGDETPLKLSCAFI